MSQDQFSDMDLKINTKELHQVAETLEKLLEEGFGPNALNSMLCTSTGKLLVTSSGATILKAINIAHPVGHMITRAVIKHHERTGDSAKTFVFLLARLLQQTSKLLDCEQNDTKYKVIRGMYAVRYDVLPNVVIPELSRVTRIVEDIDQAKETCQHLIHTVLQGKLNVAGIQHFVKIVSALFVDCKSLESIVQTAQFHLDDFDLFCVENPGKPIQSSVLLKGLLVQRDFTSMCTDFPKQNPVNFLIISCTLEQELESDVTIKISSAQQLALALDYNSKRVQKIAQHLRKSGVSLLLVVGAVSKTSCDILRSHGISVIAYVFEEDADRLARFAGVLPVYDVDDLLDNQFARNMAICLKCVAVVIQQRKGVLLNGLSPKHGNQVPLPNPGQLIVAGPTNGVSSHLKQCVQSCLQAVALTFDPKLVMETGRTMNSGSGELGHGLDKDIESCQKPDLEHSTKSSSCKGKNIQHHRKTNMYTIPGGGTLEIQLYRILDEYISKNKHCVKSSTIQGCKILRDAMLAVPLKLIKNSYASPVQKLSLAHLLTVIKYNEGLVYVDAKLGNRMKVIEPVEAKHKGCGLNIHASPEGCKSAETIGKGYKVSSKDNEKKSVQVKDTNHTVSSKDSHVSVRAKEKDCVVVSEEENKIVESVPSKVLMLYHMLELYSQMLRLDSIVSVKELPVEKDDEEEADSD